MLQDKVSTKWFLNFQNSKEAHGLHKLKAYWVIPLTKIAPLDNQQPRQISLPVTKALSRAKAHCPTLSKYHLTSSPQKIICSIQCVKRSQIHSSQKHSYLHSPTIVFKNSFSRINNLVYKNQLFPQIRPESVLTLTWIIMDMTQWCHHGTLTTKCTSPEKLHMTKRNEWGSMRLLD